MANMIMMVGMQGSGKSTFAKNMKDYVVHSSDELRKELFGSVNYQEKNNELFDELHKRIINDLKKGKNVIYDAMNISYKRRILFLEKLNNIACKKICYIMATPYSQCVKNSRNREVVITEKAIKRTYMNFTIPQLSEGFDEINFVWNYNINDFKIDDALVDMKDISHGNPHHTNSIGVHMFNCGKELKKLVNDDISYRNLYIASQIHDIGKPFTKEYNPKKGYFTYYQHQFVGAYDSLFYLKSLNYESDDKLKFTDDDILEIANIIQWHMQPYFINTDKAKEKFKNLVGEKTYKNIMLLNDADILAK